MFYFRGMHKLIEDIKWIKVKMFLLEGKKIMLEVNLRQPGFTQSACRPLAKTKETI